MEVWNNRFLIFLLLFREENWSAGKTPKNGTEAGPEAGEGEDRGGNYDGPPGMDPDGVIESNWDKVWHLYSLHTNISL